MIGSPGHRVNLPLFLQTTAIFLFVFVVQLFISGVHEMADWTTLKVTGPSEVADLRGRVWFEYGAVVISRGPFDRTGG